MLTLTLCHIISLLWQTPPHVQWYDVHSMLGSTFRQKIVGINSATSNASDGEEKNEYFSLENVHAENMWDIARH